MKGIVVSVLLLFWAASAAHVISARHNGGPQTKAPATSKDQEQLLALGKKLFVEKCAKCHDERGDKPLTTGLPLSERKLAHDEIARMVSGRLKTASEEERRAVVLYVESFMKRD